MLDFLGEAGYGKKKFRLDIGGDIEIPVWIAKGKSKGKTLVVTTGVHGDEYIGPLAVRRLYDEVCAEHMCGNLIVLPLVNMTGFYEGSRLTARKDYEDLNQAFPGDEHGSFVSKLAYQIQKHIYPLADFIIDVHGGSINEPMTPLLFYPAKVEAATSKRAKDLAKDMEVDYILASSASRGLYSYAANIGIPAILLEIGGAGERDKKNVDRAVLCLKRAMAHLDIAYERGSNPLQRESVQSSYVEAEGDAYWYPEIEVSQRVKKGDILGILRDIDDAVIKEIVAEYDAVIWYYTKNLGVSKGMNLVAYGKVEEAVI